MEQLDELLICRLDQARKTLEPCSLIIFGASGDLTSRKLIPALYNLFNEGQLPKPFRIVGFGRREKSDEAWRKELRQAAGRFSRTQVDEARWEAFAGHLGYCTGDYDDPPAYARLRAGLERFDPSLRHNLVFYLATPPSQFAGIVERLAKSALVQKQNPDPYWQRVVVEKPFGHDLASARELNASLTRHLHEQQIFRIDHYLGKETVQNLMVFRFSNAVFEPLWNRQTVDHVQITVSEQEGVAGRGGYYEEAGALRDMVQNHLLQVLALVAMEPPASLEAEAIRDEKVKLLKCVRPPQPGSTPPSIVRGQYQAGQVAGGARPAYRQEPHVNPDSSVETFVAWRLWIDNWRWSGVPFYLRTGKNLPVRASEVRVQFRSPPQVLFAAQCGPSLDNNSITLRLQPDEGITLRLNGKIPGTQLRLRPVRMRFGYDAEFGAYTPEAYERLLLEAIAGDPTLFIRRDEVETAWSLVDDIRRYWQGRPLTEAEFYPAGAWGPAAADELLTRLGHAWRNPSLGS